MKTAVLRDELHTYIDALPERSLPALKPLLSLLVEPSYTIETDLTDEETALIEDGMAEYQSDPSSFTPWAKVRRG
jgi:hypothetical protein